MVRARALPRCHVMVHDMEHPTLQLRAHFTTFKLLSESRAIGGDGGVSR